MRAWVRQALLPGLATGSISSQKYKDVNMDLSGKVVVFSGTLELMTRNEARAIAVRMGAILSDTITRQTDYLIVGKNPGYKVTKAKMIGVKIIREQDWYSTCCLCFKSGVATLRESIKNTTVNKPVIPSTLILEVSAPELDLD